MRRRPFHKGLSQQTAQKRTVHLHHVWKIKSHEEENLSDSRSKRKSCSHTPVAREDHFSRNTNRFVATAKKLQDSERILQLNLRISCAYSSTITRSTVRCSTGPV